MTVSKTVSSVVRYGNGYTNEFSFPFSAAAVGDIKVARVLDTGYLDEIPRANFTVFLSGASESGMVTLDFMPEDEAPIFIWRETIPTQEVVITNQTSYNPSVVMQVWNKLTRLVQELKSEVDRAVKIPPGNDDPNGTLSIELANSILTLSPIAGDVETVASIWESVVTNAGHSTEIQTVSQHIAAVIAANGSAIQASGESFVAEDGQTVFTLSTDVFSAYNLLVKINKQLMHPEVDYEAIGRSLTLSAPSEAGDDVEVVNIGLVSMNEIEALRDQVVAAWTDVTARQAAIVTMNNNVNTKNTNVNDKHTEVVTKHNEVVQLASDVDANARAAAASATAANDAKVEVEEAKEGIDEASELAVEAKTLAETARDEAMAAALALAGAAVPLGSNIWVDCNRGAVADGWVPRDGQLIDRAFAPEFVADLLAGKYPVVTEAVWWDGWANRGKYTLGTNGTNFRIPDTNGKQAGSKAPFLRGDGYDTAIGKVVGDAIRNITGRFGTTVNDGLQWGIFESSPVNGAFHFDGARATQGYRNLNGLPGTVNPNNYPSGFQFDASRVVPTADEIRPVFSVGINIMKIRGATLASLANNPPATLGSNAFVGDQRTTGDMIARRFAAGNGGVSSEGGINANGGLTVLNGANVSGGLTVNNSATINGGAVVNGQLQAKNGIALNGGISGNGNITTSGNLQGTGATLTGGSLEMRAPSGGICFIDMTPNGWGSDFTHRISSDTDGNMRFHHANQGQIVQINSDGNMWLKPFGWMGDQLRAFECQRNSGIVEFGFINVSGNNTVDVPSPYTMVGLRNNGDNSNGYFVRGATMRSR